MPLNTTNLDFINKPWVPKMLLFIVGMGLMIIFLVSVPWKCSSRHGSQVSIVSPQELIPEHSPVRGEFRPLRFHRSDFTYQCNECHRIFLSPLGQRSGVAERHYLKFDHGSNDYCLNCHHRTKREGYVASDGSPIPADDPSRLCSKCHGLVYRDWQIGAHGRSNGYWNAALGGAKRLFCIECHDPHLPKFQALPPMPGPRLWDKQAKRGTD